MKYNPTITAIALGGAVAAAFLGGFSLGYWRVNRHLEMAQTRYQQLETKCSNKALIDKAQLLKERAGLK